MSMPRGKTRERRSVNEMERYSKRGRVCPGNPYESEVQGMTALAPRRAGVK